MSRAGIFASVSFLALVLLISIGVAFSLSSSALVTGPVIKAGTTSSLNWSGYVVTGSKGSVSDVEGSFVVPALTCPATGTYYAAFWDGIDGYNSNTVEQTGVLAECSNGSPSYSSWYEFYPSPSFTISSLAIKAGDTISVSVSYSGGSFTAAIKDVTTAQSFSASKSDHRAQRSSAEWIAEAPSSGRSILPLADFGTSYFGSDYTSVSGTNYATVGGVTGQIGSFGSSVVSITMVTSSGAIKAQPSSLSSDGMSFYVTWKSSG